MSDQIENACVAGATSVAVVTRWLRMLGAEPFVHIPDRLTEGYGPNAEAIRALRQRGIVQ